jgi:hypothetical protein
LTQGLKKRDKKSRRTMVKKQKALNDMAENEDWLDGKPDTQPRTDK